ncbi:hypothetical protein [Streptomyces sp. NPDC046685]|uniref:hypothetical protein n=1 Tax=Streptomyces sp. NPDC046685 TaxID=3157202 RepID=UPI0033C163D0
MSLSPVTAVTIPEIAAPLAALLPARRSGPWSVVPAPYSIRPNAATASITDGSRSLIVVEQAGRIEVFADRPEEYPVRPDAVADISEPVPAAALAARLLRRTLPQLDRETAAATARTSGWSRVRHNRLQDLMEVGFNLIDHGASLDAVEGTSGPGLIWATHSGATWGLALHGLNSSLALRYDGPVSGLYGLLPSLLPPADGRQSADVGSVFTRHLTDRFPQLSPVTDHEVELGSYREPTGYVALPSTEVPCDQADDWTRVVAEFGCIGADLLLAAATHLI